MSGLKNNLEKRNHFFALVSTWFVLTIAAFISGAPLQEMRYLNFAFVPAMILLAFFIHFSEKYLFMNKKKVFCIFMITAFALGIIYNYKYLWKWVKHHGGMQHASYETEHMIFKDLFGYKAQGVEIFTIHKKLEDNFILVSWYDSAANWKEPSFLKLFLTNVLYIKTQNERDEKVEFLRENGFNVKELGRVYFHSAKPLIFQWNNFLQRHHLKKRDDRGIIVYKITDPRNLRKLIL